MSILLKISWSLQNKLECLSLASFFRQGQNLGWRGQYILVWHRPYFNDRLLALTTNLQLAMDKRCSLLGWCVNDEEKCSVILQPGLNVIKLFIALIYGFS
jgi:hypothetical protein